MEFNLSKVKIFVWICLLSISTWWGSKSIIRYWNQPLTTNLVYTFGDNENGIQFPLMTFCRHEFVSKNQIFKNCADNVDDFTFFIDLLTECSKNDKNFNMSEYMNSLQEDKSAIVNISKVWDGYKFIELQHLYDKIWTRIFHPLLGPCYTFDLTNLKNFKFIPYLRYSRPTIDFFLSKYTQWETLTIFLHTKNDLPDAFQLNGRISLSVSNQSKETHKIAIQKIYSEREPTRKIPCTQYEYMTCQNIEDNYLVLNQYNCQIPAIHFGQHLVNLIPQETYICSDEVVKKAFELITNKISNCSRVPTCKKTRFKSVVTKTVHYGDDPNVVWIGFSNPEVANYKTYISYDLTSLIGEVGGIFGLTLGVSALTFFESILNHIPYH